MGKSCSNKYVWLLVNLVCHALVLILTFKRMWVTVELYATFRSSGAQVFLLPEGQNVVTPPLNATLHLIAI